MRDKGALCVPSEATSISDDEDDSSELDTTATDVNENVCDNQYVRIIYDAELKKEEKLMWQDLIQIQLDELAHERKQLNLEKARLKQEKKNALKARKEHIEDLMRILKYEYKVKDALFRGWQ